MQDSHKKAYVKSESNAVNAVLACNGNLMSHVGAANNELHSDDYWIDIIVCTIYIQKHLSNFSIPHTTSQMASLVPVWQTLD